MRLFFAIRLPGAMPLWTHLDYQCDLLAAAGYRIVPRANLHITLNFIGEADRETTARLIASASDVNVAPFVMALWGPLITLPDQRNPRVLAYPVRNHAAELAGLAKQLGNVRADGFLPHVTVARANSPRHLPPLPDLPRVEIPIAFFYLMSSELRRDGAVYSIIKEFPLR